MVDVMEEAARTGNVLALPLLDGELRTRNWGCVRSLDFV